MPEPTDLDRDLDLLDLELKRLEAEYTMFFGGRLPRPPWETRGRVAALLSRYGRAHIQNSVDRFRFGSIQARYATFARLWDRALRAREEGRPGPFALPAESAKRPAETSTGRAEGTVLFRHGGAEPETLRELYEQVNQARKDLRGESVSFQKFAALVTEQLARLRAGGASAVAFRVGVKDGRIRLTAHRLRPTE